MLTQRPELHGPPAYFTPDWSASRRSVERLVALEPARVVTGHGPPLQGGEMLQGLRELARDFDRVAVPRRGRYVFQPAVADETGVVRLPPPVPDPLPRVLLGIGLSLWQAPWCGERYEAVSGARRSASHHRAERQRQHIRRS